MRVRIRCRRELAGKPARCRCTAVATPPTGAHPLLDNLLQNTARPVFQIHTAAQGTALPECMEDNFEVCPRCGHLKHGRGARSAIQEMETEFGFPVIRVARLTDLIGMREAQIGDPEHLAALWAYRDRYGVRASCDPRAPVTGVASGCARARPARRASARSPLPARK